MFHVVLVEPEIPPNTGNIARLCAATGSHLHLIGPLGFRLDDSTLKRAGMDYWKQVRWSYHENFDALEKAVSANSRFWLVETVGSRPYTEANYCDGDCLVFGRETKGLPPSLCARHADRCLHIPMINPESRSLNLSNCAAIVLYEALRQTGSLTALTP